MISSFEAAVWLNMVPVVGPVRFKNLKNHFGTIEKVFSASFKELQLVEGVSSVVAQAIIDAQGRFSLAENEIKLAKESGIEILSADHPCYPRCLNLIYDAPPVLYVKGDLSVFNQVGIAIVGSRRATPYGRKTSGILSRGLAGIGVVTVSGLARGIDSAVHRATLDAGGKTIAVLGSGLLDIYPAENKKLALEISQSGLLMSEFPLRFPPDSGHFPRRNRLIAGLSLGTVVVEADEKSGALITAKFALEQGKEVFAVPGPVDSVLSFGPHLLIKQGAKLVENYKDIAEEIPSLKKRFSFEPKNNQESVLLEPQIPKNLSSEEKNILTHLCLDPAHIDEIASRSAVKVNDLAKVLLDLEMKGVVRSLPGQNYVRS